MTETEGERMVYFPNGSAGEVLDIQCGDCQLGEKACPIYFVQQEFNYKQIGRKQLKKAMNYLVDKKGVCLMKPFIDDIKIGYDRRSG